MRTYRILSASAALAFVFLAGAPAVSADRGFADAARSHNAPHAALPERGHADAGRRANAPPAPSFDRSHGDAARRYSTARPVYSEGGRGSGRWSNAPHNDYTFDHRYGHDRYYPPRGFTAATLPHGYKVVPYGGAYYYFYGGVWYRPVGARFVVVTPPVGLVVFVLPPFYTTLWVGGAPYYYANGVYYTWRPAERSYVVSQAPADTGATSVASASPDRLFVYPKDGQSEQQQASDRYECHLWAANETGFDPSQAVAGLSTSELGAKHASYQRAMTACLTGRGYTVE